MSRQPKTPANESIDNPGLARVIEHIVATTPPSKLFELYYWAQEPRLLKLFRSFATLESASQEALLSFFELNRNGATVATRGGPRGELILEAKHAQEAAGVHSYLIEDDNSLDTCGGRKSH